MKKIEVRNDGILIYDGFVDNEFNERFINFYSIGKKSNRDLESNYTTLHKNDLSVFLVANDELLEDFNKLFFEDIYKVYTKKFPAILEYNFHRIVSAKIQETKVTQGYHIWHCENYFEEHSKNRILSFILYLNDDYEGGETEFLYQSLRLSPKKNRLVVFPSFYTHVHRGNPPLSGTKYIFTGWVETVPEENLRYD